MKCCRQTKGCFSVRNWSILCFILGAILIAAAIVLPPVINKLVDEKVCDKVCIPRSSDDATTRGNWLTNTNRDMNPLETYKFYVYNITNTEEMVRDGAYPVVTMHGPYVYELYREKFNVSYNSDESEVAYESREMYTFRQDLSPNVSEHDLIRSVNVPTVASWYLIQQSTLPEAAKQMSLFFLSGACDKYPEGDLASCLFVTRTAQDVIFKQDSQLINLANQLYYKGTDVALAQLHPILNGSTNADWAQQQRWGHNFGLGGEYIPRQLKLNDADLRVVGAVPTDARDVRTKQRTGHGNLKDVSETTMYVGNITLNMWEHPVQVTGRDSYQVQPFLDDSDVISIFDPQIMRSVNFQYDHKVSLLDVEMNRYYPNNLLNGYDQTYYGPNITGLFNASMIATIRYGVPTPIYVSRPYLAGVNAAWTRHITCTNCPNVHMMNRDDLEIYVDIEPTIGKVLRGRKRAQTNILIGDPTIFGNHSQYNKNNFRWANVSETLVPVVWFEYGAEMDQHQADLVKDGLSQIHIAHIATSASLYGGAGAGSLLVVFAIVLLLHYRRLRAFESMEVYEREPMMNVSGPSDGVYASRTPYYQG